MTDDKPVACSLDAGELEGRLAAIAAVGGDSLISHQIEDDKHWMRFRADASTRRRLDEIVAAEVECCSFLDLSLAEEDGALLLSISAPEQGQPIADELAAAFSPHVGASAPLPTRARTSTPSPTR